MLYFSSAIDVNSPCRISLKGCYQFCCGPTGTKYKRVAAKSLNFFNKSATKRIGVGGGRNGL